jgi:hypothetical protein
MIISASVQLSNLQSESKVFVEMDSPDLSRLTVELLIFPFSRKVYVVQFFVFINFQSGSYEIICRLKIPKTIINI